MTTQTVKVIREVPISNHMHVGSAVRLDDGTLIYVLSGSYYGDYGRISNHWTWKEINPDGTLSEKIQSGYGRP